MTKACRYLLVFLLSVLAPINASAQVLEDDKEASLTLAFVESTLSVPEKDLNFNRAILSISQKAQRDLTGERFELRDFEGNLDIMEKELKILLEGKSGHQSITEELNRYLFEQQKFEVERTRLFDGTLEGLLLNQVLETKKGTCLSLSLIYLCLAERLDLPLYGVMVPNHFFVRYVDGETKKNIEATDKGKNYPDAYYHITHLKGFNEGVSLTELTKKETLAVYLSNLANHYKLKGDHRKAMAISEQIVKVMPNRASFYTNLGNTYERDHQIVKAIALYHKALSINPYLPEAHYNLGLAHYLYTKRYEDARKHGIIAQKLGSRMHPEFRKFLGNVR